MDIRSILKSPLIYLTFQKLAGGTHMRNVGLKLLSLQAGERILDIGCGTAYYLSQMPEVEYHGFDIDKRYIEYARARFGSRGNFYCQVFREEQALWLGQFDCVLLMGLLHHLDNDDCEHLLELIASVVAPEGRVFVLDVAVHDGQNKVEQLLARSDRGEFVRRPEEFMTLARRSFSCVEGGLSPKVWWVPSIFWYMMLRSPKTRESQTTDAIELSKSTLASSN